MSETKKCGYCGDAAIFTRIDGSTPDACMVCVVLSAQGITPLSAQHRIYRPNDCPFCGNWTAGTYSCARPACVVQAEERGEGAN